VIYAFDTLSYARKLKDAGIPQSQAEAHADAARQFIMAELVTKQDLAAAIEMQTLRLTVRLGSLFGGLLALGIAALAALIKLG
jgi:hypothetical protein